MVFGNLISIAWFSKESKKGGFLDSIRSLNVFDGVVIEKNGLSLNFTATENDDIEFQALKQLDGLPGFVSPLVICSILGGLLQEQIVVLHSSNRIVIYQLMMFLLSLIYPLQWPYPIIPLLVNSQMQDYLESPVPLLCGVEEDPDQFEELWEEKSKKLPSVLHIQLEKACTLGKTNLNFRDSIMKAESNYNWERCKTLAKQLQDPSRQVYWENIKLDYLLCFRRAIRSLFIDPLDKNLLHSDSSPGYTKTIQDFQKNSLFPPSVTDRFVHGQIFSWYLQSQQKAIS